MNIHKIVLNSENNTNSCFLGISINKPLMVDFWQNQIEYVENNFQKIIVLIADEIDIINQINIEGKNYEEALINTKSKYELRKQFLLKRIKVVAKKKKDSELGYEGVKNKFVFVSRGQVSKSQRFKDIYDLLKNKYLSDNPFKLEVRAILSNYLKARGKAEIISDSLLDNLSDYILNELVTLIDGIDVYETNYSCIVYPTFKETIGGMNNLAEKLYHQLNNGLELRGKILIESSFE